MAFINNLLTSASILKNTFGYDTFRPLQSEVIENVLARRDTLAIMPTGGGKSRTIDILRGAFKAHEYGDVILPFVVLRRLDLVLEPKKDDVIQQYEQFKDSLDEE